MLLPRETYAFGLVTFERLIQEYIMGSSFDRSWRALPAHVALAKSEKWQLKEKLHVIEKYCKPGILHVDETTSTGLYLKMSAYTWSCAYHFAVPSAYIQFGRVLLHGSKNLEIHDKLSLWQPLYTSVSSLFIVGVQRWPKTLNYYSSVWNQTLTSHDFLMSVPS